MRRGGTRRPVVFVPDGQSAKMLREQLQVLSPDASGEPETSKVSFRFFDGEGSDKLRCTPKFTIQAAYHPSHPYCRKPSAGLRNWPALLTAHSGHSGIAVGRRDVQHLTDLARMVSIYRPLAASSIEGKD